MTEDKLKEIMGKVTAIKQNGDTLIKAQAELIEKYLRTLKVKE